MHKLPWMWVEPRVDVPQWLAAGIGRIAVQWSDLEYEYEEIIRLLMGTHIKNGRIATTGMNMRSRVKVAHNLTQALVYDDILKPALLAQLRKLSKRVTEKLEGERNKVVHGLYGLIEGEWYLFRTTGTGDGPELPEIGKLARAVMPQKEKMTRNTIAETLKPITIARKETEAFRDLLEAALPPSPHKSPRQMRPHRQSRPRKKKAQEPPPQSSPTIPARYVSF